MGSDEVCTYIHAVMCWQLTAQTYTSMHPNSSEVCICTIPMHFWRPGFWGPQIPYYCTARYGATVARSSHGVVPFSERATCDRLCTGRITPRQFPDMKLIGPGRELLNLGASTSALLCGPNRLHILLWGLCNSIGLSFQRLIPRTGTHL